MYGLILEGLLIAIKKKYGEKAWNQILQKSGIPHTEFNVYKCYSETLVHRLTKVAMEVTGASQSELMDLYGESFVTYVGQYGYDRILRVLGRNLRDFLSGLDNLHEYLRFSFPRLKPPSFFVEDEDEDGLTIQYRSRRKGYLHYVIGQIKAVGKHFYNTEIKVEVIKEDEGMDMTNVIMRLNFENEAFLESKGKVEYNTVDNFQISTDAFFEAFPFHIVFDKTLTIRSIGSGLASVMSGVVGQAIDEMFHLTRPLVEFTLDNILSHTNNAFELTSLDPIHRTERADFANSDTMTNVTTVTNVSRTLTVDGLDDEERRKLKIKGQMIVMDSWDAILFIGTPMMENLEKMFNMGLYINDLSLHDSSRDLVLAGTQQQAELKLALDQEQQKATKLGETMQKLDEESKRTDTLLYQMIPKIVAEKLRTGEIPLNTCEAFEKVTILFSDVVGFTKICSNITPMAVVSLLNDMYTKFDKLTEKHKVYKVETIGDAYMVCGGAPDRNPLHAVHISDFALNMLTTMKELIDPSTKEHMKIRVGIHTGMAVAGVVGLKMPRWCLFGDTVNIANKMEATGESMKIQVSQATKDCLEKKPYIFQERGEIEIKEYFTIKTSWLIRKTYDDLPNGM